MNISHGMKFGKVHVIILSMIMAVILIVFLEYPFLLFKYHSWKDAGMNKYNGEGISLSTTVDVVPFSIQGLPNARFYQHGFTCTGLAYDESEDCFWAGNVGVEYPGDEPKHPSLIKLSRNFEIIDEVDAFVIASSRKNTNLQGVAYDTSDNVLWVSFGGGLLCVTKDGRLLKEVKINDHELKVNGIAYEKNTDTLWILGDSDFLLNITKSGDILARIPCDIKGQDQLTFSNDGKLCFTAGVDYHGRKNYLYEIDTNTGMIWAKYRLIDSFAVEGCCFVDGVLYVLNDGYYHNAARKNNEICSYLISDK